MAQSRCKIVFVGDMGVGKTAIINRFVHGTYDGLYNNTIGADFFAKTFMLGSRTIRLHLWDTAGQEKYRSLVSMYTRDASGVMVVYDVADRASFLNASNWINQIRESQGDGACIFLVGNKTDLTGQEKVSCEEGEEAAKQYNVKFIYV